MNSSNPRVSICMCSYRRSALLRRTLKSIERQHFPGLELVVCEDGDDGGWTRGVCSEFGVRYFQRSDRPDQPYSNPSIPLNVAIRHARGEILILQNPECEHVGDGVIEKLLEPHALANNIAAFASVAALNQDDSFQQWYCHPVASPRPYFFCGSIRRENVIRIGGFDEDFGRSVGGYGYDDDFFAFCLSASGVQFVFMEDVIVNHLWHQGTNCYGLNSNQELFMKKLGEVGSGARTFESNAGRAWGVLSGEELIAVDGE